MQDQKKENLILILLAVASAVIYFSLIFNNNVWMDEAFTASLVKTDLPGVLERSMNDTLPPLYNILLKLTTDIFGYRIPVMKGLSCLFMVLTIILSAPVIRKNFGFKSTVIYIIALTIMPNMLFFGAEIRMYSLGFMFATLSGVTAFECVREKKPSSFVCFVLSSVLAGYSHHFAFVTVGFVFLFLLIYYLLFCRAELKYWFFSVSSTLILYIPCLIVTLKQLKQVSGYFSMPEITPGVFIKYMRYPYTVGFTPLTLLLSFTVLILLFRLLSDLKNERDLTGLFSLSCFLIYYGVLVFGTIVSKLMTANIFVDRYLFFSTGLLWLFFSIEAGKLKKPLFLFIIVLEVLIGAVSFKNALASEYAEGADELIAFLHENVKEGDLLYTIEDAEGLSLSLPFYEDRLTYIGELPEALDSAGSDGSSEKADPAGFDGSSETVDSVRSDSPSDKTDPAGSSDIADPGSSEGPSDKTDPAGSDGSSETVDSVRSDGSSDRPVIWLAVLQGFSPGEGELSGYKAVPVGDFSFDRYSFTLYTLENIN